jgi:hypothetical protein
MARTAFGAVVFRAGPLAPVTAPTGTPLRATLRVAANDAERDSVIEAWLQATASGGERSRRVVFAEGLLFDRPGPHGVPIVGLTAGCPCCVGVLVLRVALGRTLRSVCPDAVLLLLAQAEHLPRLRRMLERGELGVRFEIDG